MSRVRGSEHERDLHTHYKLSATAQTPYNETATPFSAEWGMNIYSEPGLPRQLISFDNIGPKG